MADVVEEIVWRFGGRGPEGECCQDLTHVEYRALRAVGQVPECTMQEVARRLGLTKSGATRVIDRLADKGYLQRERHPQDGRVCCVVPTLAGHSLLAEIKRDFTAELDGALNRLDPSMREVVLVAFRSFARAAQGEEAVN